MVVVVVVMVVVVVRGVVMVRACEHLVFDFQCWWWRCSGGDTAFGL